MSGIPFGFCWEFIRRSNFSSRVLQPDTYSKPPHSHNRAGK